MKLDRLVVQCILVRAYAWTTHGPTVHVGDFIHVTTFDQTLQKPYVYQRSFPTLSCSTKPCIPSSGEDHACAAYLQWQHCNPAHGARLVGNRKQPTMPRVHANQDGKQLVIVHGAQANTNLDLAASSARRLRLAQVRSAGCGPPCAATHGFCHLRHRLPVSPGPLVHVEAIWRSESGLQQVVYAWEALLWSSALARICQRVLTALVAPTCRPAAPTAGPHLPFACSCCNALLMSS